MGCNYQMIQGGLVLYNPCRPECWGCSEQVPTLEAGDLAGTQLEDTKDMG